MCRQQVDSKNRDFGKSSGLENDIKNMYTVFTRVVCVETSPTCFCRIKIQHRGEQISLDFTSTLSWRTEAALPESKTVVLLAISHFNCIYASTDIRDI